MPAFRLDPVLRYRTILEKIAARKLADATTSVRLNELLLSKLKQDCHEALNILNQYLEAGADANFVANEGRIIRDSIFRIQDQIKALQNSKNVFAQRQSMYIQCASEKKAVELLREKFVQQLREQLKQAENKEMSEVGIRMFNKNSQDSQLRA